MLPPPVTQTLKNLDSEMNDILYSKQLNDEQKANFITKFCSWIFAKSRYSSLVPETCRDIKFNGTSVSDFTEGVVLNPLPLLIDVCVAGLVKSTLEICDEQKPFYFKKENLSSGCSPLLRRRFSVSCLEANCVFLVVVSFLHLFYQHRTVGNSGKVGPELV